MFLLVFSRKNFNVLLLALREERKFEKKIEKKSLKRLLCSEVQHPLFIFNFDVAYIQRQKSFPFCYDLKDSYSLPGR